MEKRTFHDIKGVFGKVYTVQSQNKIDWVLCNIPYLLEYKMKIFSWFSYKKWGVIL
jgi:hypothetical protein